MSTTTIDNAPPRYRGTYLTCGRLHSFAHQIEALLSLEPQDVLEIGPGPGVVTASLQRIGIPVTTLDIDASLNPDLYASVTEIPLADGAIDVSMCCQVLEHLPFRDACTALRELRRVTRRSLVLSVPDITRNIAFTIAAPKLGRHAFTWNAPRLQLPAMDPNRAIDGGHHWEIGYRGYALSVICDAIQDSGWTVARTWRVPELAWHRFFVLERAS